LSGCHARQAHLADLGRRFKNGNLLVDIRFRNGNARKRNLIALRKIKRLEGNIRFRIFFEPGKRFRHNNVIFQKRFQI